ncbi:MAG: hypothetical protein HYV19_00380 [Gemmatimonadetes bacterium]|nr:hypothetical protein [Gemmatimonadota bacterium]
MSNPRRDDLLFDAETLLRVVRGEMRVLDAPSCAEAREPAPMTRAPHGAELGSARVAPPASHGVTRASQGACPGRPLSPASV